MAISRRAAEELKRTVRWVKGQQSAGASFADPGYPIRLAKTTVLHATGETRDVTLLWGDKGSETEGTTDHDTVPAYNRYGDIDEDTEVHIARIGPGWEILPRGGSTGSGVSCGPCFNGAGVMTVDLGSGFMASETYQATLFCESVDPIIYGDFDTNVWTGSADPMTVDCNGTEVTFTSSLTYFSHLPGNGTSTGIVVEWSDGADTWKWVNRTAWQPGLRTELELFDGPAECPCAPFIDFPCLIPIPTPAEEE
jgi:hypothetical protein